MYRPKIPKNIWNQILLSERPVSISFRDAEVYFNIALTSTWRKTRTTPNWKDYKIFKRDEFKREYNKERRILRRTPTGWLLLFYPNKGDCTIWLERQKYAFKRDVDRVKPTSLNQVTIPFETASRLIWYVTKKKKRLVITDPENFLKHSVGNETLSELRKYDRELKRKWRERKREKQAVDGDRNVSVRAGN